MQASSSSSGNEKQPTDLSTSDKIKLLLLLVLLVGHATTIIVGASAVQYTTDSDKINYGISAVHVLLIPIAALCVMVLRKAFCSGRCFDEKKSSKWFFHPILAYLCVAIIAMWIILHKKYITTTTSTLPSCGELTIVSALYQGKEVNLESVLLIMIQIISVVVLVARFLLPRGKLSNDDLSQLLVSGLAMAFDIADLQSNIHEDNLKNDTTVAYSILVFSTLGLLQLIQLSCAFAYRFKKSDRWQIFWILYGIVVQEIPFFGIRAYIMTVGDSIDVNELIWPAKNVLNVFVGAYLIYCTYKEMRDQKNESKDAETATDVTHGPSRWHLFNTFAPIVVLLIQLSLLVWRVAVVRKTIYAALVVLFIPFVAVCLVRFVQLVKSSRRATSKSASDRTGKCQACADKAHIWFKPLLMYAILAFLFMVLIIEGMAGEEDGFSKPSSTKVKCVDTYGKITTEKKPKFKVNDKTSYAMIQTSLPMIVIARAWMPRGDLTLPQYSSLLALHLTIAFDIAEFGHLAVDLLSREETWTDDGAIAIRRAIFTFIIAGMILLAVMEGGFESQSKNKNEKYVRIIVWTALLVLLLDGPFFIIRVYVLAAFKIDVEDLQLIFLLKNTLVIAFGVYRIVSLGKLWKEDRIKSSDKEPIAMKETGDQSLLREPFREAAGADNDESNRTDVLY